MTKTRTNRLRIHMTGLGVLVLVFGLLLWARFLLVTGHPRTAYAEPAEASPHAAASADANR